MTVSVAGDRAASVEDGPVLGDEAPLVGGRVQDQLQHPVGVADAHLAVGFGGGEAQQVGAAGADHELADPLPAGRGPGGLTSEPLIAVLMAAQDHVGAGLIEVVPEAPERAPAPLMGPRGEPGKVPVGQDAALGGGDQVGPEPALLGRPRSVVEAGVQRDQVPAAQVEAVVAAALGPGLPAEVGEVAGRSGGLVVGVARYRPGPGLEPAPGRTVGAPVLAQPALGYWLSPSTSTVSGSSSSTR